MMTNQRGMRAACRTRAARKVAIGFAVLAAPLSASVEAAEADDKSPWQFDGSVRLRYEAFDGGYRAGGPDSADALSFRTSLSVQYNGNGWRAGAEVRDSRAYLNDSRTPLGTGDIDALQIPQAWVSVDLSRNLSATAGRFVMNLGSKRLVGDPVFRNTANAFTGLRLDWQGKGKTQASLFYTLPDTRLPEDRVGLIHNKVVLDRERWDLRFWGAFVSTEMAGVKAEGYVYGLDEDDYPGVATRNRHLVTVGSRLRGAPAKALTFELEGAIQRGTIRTSTSASAPRVPVHAYMAHGELGYALGGAWKPKVSLLADIASGDKRATRAYERFDNLFGPRREWGPTSLYGPLGPRNFEAIGLKLDVTPSKRLDGNIEWRRVGLVSATDSFAFTKVVDARGQSGRDAGNQFQGRMRYWVKPKALRLELGAAILVKGRFLRDAPNAPDNGDTHYGYMDVTYSF